MGGALSWMQRFAEGVLTTLPMGTGFRAWWVHCRPAECAAGGRVSDNYNLGL